MHNDVGEGETTYLTDIQGPVKGIMRKILEKSKIFDKIKSEFIEKRQNFDLFF